MISAGVIFPCNDRVVYHAVIMFIDIFIIIHLAN